MLEERNICAALARRGRGLRPCIPEAIQLAEGPNARPGNAQGTLQLAGGPSAGYSQLQVFKDARGSVLQLGMAGMSSAKLSPARNGLHSQAPSARVDRNALC